MKIDVYVDIYPHMKIEHIVLTTSPGAKVDGCKRYKATINIPDSAFYGDVDGYAPVEGVTEVDK